ncbi:copper transport protein CTR2 [Acrasis kona]|uniref:Copper transport protein n=1 Tax=Acrasis kona TaxID=1008807 RepID=A0AAW2ZPK4_9EUKA
MEEHHHHHMPASASSCDMKMVFNWDLTGLCVIFEWWKINDSTTMIGSFFIILLLSALYERLRQFGREYDISLSKQRDEASGIVQLKRSLLYGIQVLYAFMLMLIFMTYNGYLMAATALGAAIGFFFFNKDLNNDKGMACH